MALSNMLPSRQFPELPLRVRLFGLAGLSLLSTILLGSYAFWQFLAMERELRLVAAINLPLTRVLTSMRVHELDHSKSLLGNINIASTPRERQEAIKSREKYFAYLDAVDRELTDKGSLARHHLTGDKSDVLHTSLERIVASWDEVDLRQHELVVMIKGAFALQEKGDFPGGAEGIRQVMMRKEILLEEIEDIHVDLQLMTNTALTSLELHQRRVLEWSLGGFLLIGVLVSLLARTTLVKIINPLHKAIGAAQDLEQEGGRVRLSPTTRDELGALLEAINRLSETMRERDELKRQLFLSDKMAALGSLSVGVAHEINNPLTTALLGVHRVRQGLKQPDGRDKLLACLDQVEDNLQRAARIASDLLTFAWTGALEGERVDLAELIEEVIDLLPLVERGILCQWRGPSPAWVWGDRLKLTQVLLNLCQNAMDAMPQGGDLLLTTRREGGQMVLEIWDNGAGIPPEHLNRVLEPFFTTKPAGKGTGLGLPICYNLIHQHGGDMEITSQPGTGTTIVVRLPLHDGQDR